MVAGLPVGEMKKVTSGEWSMSYLWQEITGVDFDPSPRVGNLNYAKEIEAETTASILEITNELLDELKSPTGDSA